MKTKTTLVVALAALFGASVSMANAADKLEVKVQKLDLQGNTDIGIVTVTESPYGLVFTPNLTGLTEVYMVSIFTKMQVVSQKRKMAKWYLV